MTGNDKPSTSEEMIGRLIAAAGKGSTASPEAKQRIYDAVHARWRSDNGRSDSAADDELDHSANERSRHRLHARANRRRNTHAYRRFRAFGIAATVALAAVTAYWLQGPQPQSRVDRQSAQFEQVAGSVVLLRTDGTIEPVFTDSGNSIRLGETLRTSTDGRVALRFDDGLIARIDAMSELIFAAPDEIDLLAGRIYIDTGDGGSDYPLRIDTVLGQIEHLGTQYEVQLSDSTLRVRVREGSITYSSSTGTEIGQAGEQLNIDADGLASRSRIAPHDPDWEWASMLAALPESDQYRVGDVLVWIARELGLQLDYSNLAIERRVTNQVLVGLGGLNPTETLDVLQRTTDVVAEISGEQLLIRN